MSRLSHRDVIDVAQALPDAELREAMRVHAEAASRAAREANERQRWAAAMQRELKRRRKA